MGNQLDVESLNTLIQAIQKYKEELELNKKILLNAADVCDQASGSDDKAKKHIARLHEALLELDKTVQLSEDVAAALIADRNLAISVLED